MTFYEILEISENASPEVIHMAYKALAKKYHPDLNKDNPQFAEEQMKRINEAYEVLSDPEKRKRYDICLSNQIANGASSKSNNDRTNYSHQNQETVSGTKNQTYATEKRSIITISLLLLLNLISMIGSNANAMVDTDLYDVALPYSLLGFLVLSSVLIFFPLLIGGFIKDRNLKTIKIICAVNSILAFVASCILMIFEIFPLAVGGLGAITYYFINKHILFLFYAKEHEDNKRRIITGVIAVVSVVVTVLGIVFSLMLLKPKDSDFVLTYEMQQEMISEECNFEKVYNVTYIEIAANSSAGVGDVFTKPVEKDKYKIIDNSIGDIYYVNYKLVADDWWYSVTLSNGTEAFIWGGVDGMYVNEH